MHTLAEDLLLLALDDEDGVVAWQHAPALPYGLAGALLMDLALLGRVTSVHEQIITLDPSPTGEAELDAALELIHGSDAVRLARHWVRQLGDQPGLTAQLARRLVARGILREQEHTFLWLFHSLRFPTSEPGREASVRDQIRALVLGSAAPDARTLMLLSLIYACKLTDDVFSREERVRAARRIKDLVEHEQFGAAVGEAVADTLVAITAAVNAAVFTVTVAPGASH